MEELRKPHFSTERWGFHLRPKNRKENLFLD
jgi:hypothetical protein